MIPIPPALKNYAAEITALGYVLKKCDPSPTQSGCFDVQILTPKDKGLEKPSWEFEHDGWKPTGSISSEPSSKGLLTTTTIKRVS